MHDVEELHETPASWLLLPLASGLWASGAQPLAPNVSMRFWYMPAAVRNVPTLAHELDEVHVHRVQLVQAGAHVLCSRNAHALPANCSVKARSTPPSS